MPHFVSVRVKGQPRDVQVFFAVYKTDPEPVPDRAMDLLVNRFVRALEVGDIRPQVLAEWERARQMFEERYRRIIKVDYEESTMWIY